MSRTLHYDIPGPDWRVTPEEVREKGWAAVLGRPAGRKGPLVVEFGFGRGEFLLAQASAVPERDHVGIEVSFKRVLKMARRLARTELSNLRLVHAPAERVLDLFGRGSVWRFWINFPDPWPKKRHLARRLVTPALVRHLARCLAPGGEIHMATDHVLYAETMHETLSGEPLLENLHEPQPFVHEVPERPATAYELEWRAEGRECRFFAYRRKENG